MLAKWRPKLIKKTPKWKKSQHEPWNVPIIFLNSWICFKSCTILYPAHDKKPKKEDKKKFVINSCYQLLNVYYKNTFYYCPLCILYIFLIFHYQQIELAHKQPFACFFTCFVWYCFTLCSMLKEICFKKWTSFKQMYKLWVTIYESFKNMYENLKNTFVYNKCPYL